MEFTAHVPPLAWLLLIVPGICLAFWLITGVLAAKKLEQDDDPDLPS